MLEGLPPAWTPPAEVRRLKEDDGTYFRDPNAARYPSHPMEPAVRAIFEAYPDFPRGSVDIVACSSTLGNLLRCVRGDDKPFKFLIEAIGSNVFLERRERSPTEVIPDIRGFGHTFPEAYTSWDQDVKGSIFHQRIITYAFSGLKCVVRFGVDGYMRGDHPVSPEKATPAAARSLKPDSEDLSATLKQSRLTASPLDANGSLHVIAGGSMPPQTSILELKTRSFRKKDQDIVAGELPRLWLTQIGNFVLAYHEAGLFNDVRQIDVNDRVKQWESDSQDTLRKFSILLHEIVALARSTNAKRLELRWRGPGILEVSEASLEVGQTLSVVTEARWRAQTEDASSEDASSEEDQSPDGMYGEHHISYSEDEESEKDFTACSAEDCGYCGHCSY